MVLRLGPRSLTCKAGSGHCSGFGALGALGAFGAFGTLGAFGAVGAVGAFGALGALGAVDAAGEIRLEDSGQSQVNTHQTLSNLNINIQYNLCPIWM